MNQQLNQTYKHSIVCINVDLQTIAYLLAFKSELHFFRLISIVKTNIVCHYLQMNQARIFTILILINLKQIFTGAENNLLKSFIVSIKYLINLMAASKGCILRNRSVRSLMF